MNASKLPCAKQHARHPGQLNSLILIGAARAAYARADGPPSLQLINHGKGSPIYPGIRPTACPPP